MLRVLAQSRALVDEIMRRKAGVPINPTSDAAITGTRTIAIGLPPLFREIAHLPQAQWRAKLARDWRKGAPAPSGRDMIHHVRAKS